MRYRELTENIETPAAGSAFYHVTTNTRLKAIMVSGIEPGHHRRWKNTMGGKLGDRGYIYLISDLSHAIRWAAKQDYLYRMDGKQTKTLILVVRNVPTKGLERDPNIEGQIAGHSWYRIKAVIPPSDIVRVIPLTPEMIQQVVNGGTAEMPPEEIPEPVTKTVSPHETHSALAPAH